MKIYIGCAINTKNDHVWELVETLKAQLHAEGHQLLNFVGTDPSVSAETVYHTDLACTTEADVMIAIADIPSTGLGMEIQKRIELKKPILICHQEDAKISRMVLGAAETLENVRLVVYKSEADILEALPTV